MKVSEVLVARFLALGVYVTELKRTRAGRVQLLHWAASWEAEARIDCPTAFPNILSSIHTMTMLARGRFNRWRFFCSGAHIKVTMTTSRQPPPFGLKRWPKDPA